MIAANTRTLRGPRSDPGPVEFGLGGRVRRTRPGAKRTGRLDICRPTVLRLGHDAEESQDGFARSHDAPAEIKTVSSLIRPRGVSSPYLAHRHNAVGWTGRPAHKGRNSRAACASDWTDSVRR